MVRHLDNKKAWEEFYLSDGTVETSKDKNWRDVAWDKVVKIEAHINGKFHTVDDSGPGFLAFLNFRWGGSMAIYDKLGKYVGHRAINTWTIAWTDGKKCFQKNIDFRTGNLISECSMPIEQFIEHLHPTVKGRVLGAR